MLFYNKQKYLIADEEDVFGRWRKAEFDEITFLDIEDI